MAEPSPVLASRPEGRLLRLLERLKQDVEKAERE